MLHETSSTVSPPSVQTLGRGRGLNLLKEKRNQGWVGESEWERHEQKMQRSLKEEKTMIQMSRKEISHSKLLLTCTKTKWIG
jgi:hypothetical protein